MLTITRHIRPSEAAAGLYESSFPYAERRSLREHALLARREADFYACEMRLSASGEFVGILYYWLLPEESLCYAEHLAVVPERRGEGLGHAALEYLKRLGFCIILEIEPVVDAPTARRLAFYQSAGFCRLPHPHVQLAYHADSEPVVLELLSWRPSGAPASDAQVAALEKVLREQIMLRCS